MLHERTVEQQLAALVQQAQAAGVLPTEIGFPELWNQFKVFRANGRAMLAYKPQLYPGRITFFQAEDSAHKSLAWRELARGGMETRIIPGDDYNML